MEDFTLIELNKRRKKSCESCCCIAANFFCFPMSSLKNSDGFTFEEEDAECFFDFDLMEDDE